MMMMIVLIFDLIDLRFKIETLHRHRHPESPVPQHLRLSQGRLAVSDHQKVTISEKMRLEINFKCHIRM